MCSLALLAGTLPGTALAAGSPPPGAANGWSAKTFRDAAGQDAPDRVPAADREKTLGAGYKASKDRAWTTSGDARGFHLMVADAKDGYAWKTAATLSEPGFEADAWIGNACVTRSGKRAAVAYAPRTFTNKPELMVRGAFAAIVDLTTGKVTKLANTASLAYFSPGCGSGEKTVFTQLTTDGDKQSGTRLISVDAASGKSAAPLHLDGQVTSAVPTGQGIVAAHGKRLVRIGADGGEKEIARTRTVPFQLRPDRSGGVTFIERLPVAAGGKSSDAAVESAARRVSATQIGRGGATPATLARGPLTDWDLSAAADGTVYVTGKARTRGTLPDSVKNPGTLAKDDRISTLSDAAVGTSWVPDADSPVTTTGTSDEARPVRTRLRLLDTGAEATLEALPGGTPLASAQMGTGATSSPALAVRSGTAKSGGTAKVAAGSPSNPVEAERTCAVPRNDPRKQALQPTPRQAEWAVDQAVIDGLYMWVSRQANWNNTGMSPYTPQTLFPLPVLAGDPNGVVDRADEWHIPAQILLGVTAQESNMWQATRTVVPGVTGNSLIGNFYGIKYSADGDQADPWAVNWAKADCGYGITQVTDGMRLSDTTLTTAQKEAAALDYTANIAYGASILASKWNDTRAAGMTVNGGKPKYIENWFFALWAYNSGFHPQSQAGSNGGKWGVGWTNNPANPLWKENRLPFLESSSGGDDYSHAATPQYWPYQEKVIGWAARPISAMFKPGDMQAGYRAAWWNNNAARTRAKPPNMIFCTASNDCDDDKILDGSSNQTGKGPCLLPGDPDETNPLYLKCWWHESVKWKDCEAAAECGNPVHRFNNADYPEQPDENSSYPPRCASASGNPPSGSLVIDDVPNGVTPTGQSGHTCGQVASAGTFAFDFAESNGTYPGKIDLHQIGAGYGDHFWFTHTRKATDTDGSRLRTTGTWTLGKSLNQWSRIMVHVPDHGAHTQQADYEIDTGSGSFTRHRSLGQERKANTWVSLGTYKISGTPRVRLASTTLDGTGDEDVAWDAVAFQPLAAKPKHIVAVLGDSFTSGEGAGSYSPESDKDHGEAGWNACRRSANAWPRKLVLPGTTESLGKIADTWGTSAELGFVACSGAMSKNVAYQPNYNNDPQNHLEGQFKEVLQTESGVLSDDTTLVMLTLGGNDEGGFASAMQECGGLGDCSSDSDFLPGYKAVVDRMTERVQAALEDVATRASNARIVLMGYPELLSRSVKCGGSLYYDMTEVKALAELVNYADDKQKVMVDALRTGTSKLKVDYADPVSAFVGHSGCDDPEWINKFVLGPNGDGDFHLGDAAAVPASCLWGALGGKCLSRESFHPKDVGTTGYAEVMRLRLNAIGYTGTP